MNPDISKRIVLAPVGEQPAAVMALLLSRSEASLPQDHVVLIASSRTKPQAERIGALLAKATGLDPQIQTAEVPKLSVENLKALEAMVQGEEAAFIINGTGSWTSQIVKLLRSHASSFILVHSHDQQGQIISYPESEIATFPIQDMGLITLLKLLELKFDQKRNELRPDKSHPGNGLMAIASLLENAGMLYAVVDASELFAPLQPKDKVATYRRLFLDRDGLQRLGLEKRRLLLLNVESSLRKMAMQDALPVEGPGLPLARREKLVKDGKGVSIGEKKGKPAVRPGPQPYPAEGWANDPMVVVMSPQPEITLQALSVHQPREIVVLYDGASPRATKNAYSLAQSTERKGTAHFLPWPEGDISYQKLESILQPWSQKDVTVNLTADDELLRLLLYLWCLACPEKRKIMEREDLIAGMPSIQAWVDSHARAPVRLEGPQWIKGSKEPLRLLLDLTEEVLQWLSVKGSSPWLDRLWKRNDGLRLAGRELYVGEKLLVNLDDLAVLDQCQDLPSAFLPERPDTESNGQWFEWIVGLPCTELEWTRFR